MLKTYLNQIMEPPIVKVNNEINRMKKEGKKIINLGQAVVNFFPDEKIIDEINSMFKKIEFHYYSPDEGFLQLRELICAQLNKDFNCFIQDVIEDIQIGKIKGSYDIPMNDEKLIAFMKEKEII